MTARFDATNQNARIARLKAERLQREAALATERQSLERLKLIGLIGALTALALFAVGFLAFRAVQRSRNRVSEANVKLSHAARHDALTGLPNRRYVRELLHDRLIDAATGAPCAFMLIDLDRFKAVNDTLGHEAGDRCCSRSATRLHELLPEGAYAGRLGGDEFAAILTDATDPTRSSRSPATSSAPCRCPTRSAARPPISAPRSASRSAISTPTGRRSLTRNADLALYRSKNKGRGASPSSSRGCSPRPRSAA